MLSVVAALTFVVSGYAQVTTAAIGGRVNDAQGAVEGAPVIAVHVPSGSSYYSVTDKNGFYHISGIAPGGPYAVSVEMLGYKAIKTNNLYTEVGQTSTIDFTLQDDSIGLEAAVLSADAADSGMNIRRSGSGTTISRNTMDALPTANRTMNDVMKLTPQASVTSNGLAVGGGNYRASYVTVDGAAFNNAFGIGSNLPAGGAPISLDALEQMSVNITPFDVRQSGFTGGAINAVTKSGTNDVHVAVYNYYSSNLVTGHKVGDVDLANSETLANTTGVSVGGPIIKNKLFFFANFEYDMDKTEGSNRLARTSDTGAWGAENIYNRPTVAFMDEVKSYLADTYGYNPGRYQDYSLSTPDWKFMARIDWNINENNKLNVRYSQTMNKYSSSPSSSVNPINPKPYDKDKYGRTSYNALCFESSRYFQEQNFMSLAAELNTRLSNKVANTLRFTWSHQNEPRSFVGDLFPTVDILQPLEDGTSALLTSFGPDPFTYGNLRDVQTIVATDEVNINLGKHNLVAGVQFEYDKTKNGYMQGGAGYYVYPSWDAFKAAGKPSAFAITHANRDDLQQVYPSFEYMQSSIYAQDEMSLTSNFKLTAGVRLEVPVYPTIVNNDNAEFKKLAANSATFKGMSTADMPSASLVVSPRIGFNWDVLRNRNLIVRGGSGIYTGRIPFVWIVSAAGNSNNLQAQFIDAKGENAMTPGFHQSIPDILTDLYGGTFKAKDLAAPTATTILDKDLKMPTTWKSSLAVDFTLPGGIKGTVEGIYNYDMTSVTVHKLGQVENGEVKLAGEPAGRTAWKSESIKNSQNSTVQPYVITNSDLHGSYYSVTAQLRKNFACGLDLMAAYTRSQSKVLADGLGDQISSAYNTMTYNVNGSNVDELGYSTYVSPNRLIANVSYRIKEGNNLGTTIGLFYEGYNYCYVGSYSYTRYSYTLGEVSGSYTNPVTGDGGALNMVYIPTDKDLESMPFADDANKAAFKSFLASDSYLSSHRGEYMERGGKVAPWYNRFDFKVAQDFNFRCAGKVNTFQLGIDIQNVGNLLNSDWGCVQRVSGDTILKLDGGKYKFEEPKWTKYNSTVSTWKLLISARLFF